MSRTQQKASQREAQARIDSLTETAAMFAQKGRGVPSAVIDEAAIATVRGGKINRHKAPPAFVDAVAKAADLVRERAAKARLDREAKHRLMTDRPKEWMDL